MASPRIETFEAVTPWIYSWATADVPKYDGWEKIGYTEQADPDVRIAQQASQLSVDKHKLWQRRATYLTDGSFFTDKAFHAFLQQRGVQRELSPKRTEWFRFDDQLVGSLDLFGRFANGDPGSTRPGVVEEDYVLRAEQEAAVQQALAAFDAEYDEVLWNAKPRFGKTLASYDLMRQLEADKVLILTNRPAIANSWFDDFQRFIGHQTLYKFVSEADALKGRGALTREAYRKLLADRPSARAVEFISLQDLKGAKRFGGAYDKLGHVAGLEWDLVIVDEAHEGVDTVKTEIAFEQIKRRRTLHLSGTPFKALASGKYDDPQIFNWTYVDEQEARQAWPETGEENPYQPLPRLNLLTYQVSPMLRGVLAEGAALDEDERVDYTFDLNKFFETKDNGFFVHEAEVAKFLDSLTTHEKYPFSTPELRDELRHTFWLLNRVASARALAKMLAKHPVFGEYEVVLAAGDGRGDDDEASTKALQRVEKAIETAEALGKRTITLSVGQLTTGVTVPQWTAVVMLSTLASPAQYMQAAFRAQNPCTFVRNGVLLRKRNAYVFDFAPERTLQVYDAFANNLRSDSPVLAGARQDNIRELLNFFPVLGEDAEGMMIELDAGQVLTFPQVVKAREVVRRGFMSNLLFTNIGGIFREQYQSILEKLPATEQGKPVQRPVVRPEPVPVLDADGQVVVDAETVINPKIAELGKAVFVSQVAGTASAADDAVSSTGEIADEVVAAVSDKLDIVAGENSWTSGQRRRQESRVKAKAQAEIGKVYARRGIERTALEKEVEQAATEAELEEVQARIEELDAELQAELAERGQDVVDEVLAAVVTEQVIRTEHKKAEDAIEAHRGHLRGFCRTIPIMLMAYGDPSVTLATFDAVVDPEVFEEISGITVEEFRMLRDGVDVENEDGEVVHVPGMFDALVFDQSIQEFLTKKGALADYFDESLDEDIFAYIPQQKTSLVFTPKPVVVEMVDALEASAPGIFTDPDKTFADLFSTAGLFLMELVRRLDKGLVDVIPDREERIKHILTQQLYEMSHNEILHRVTLEAVSGGDAERKEWMAQSGHYRVGNMSAMTVEEIEEAFE